MFVGIVRVNLVQTAVSFESRKVHLYLNGGGQILVLPATQMFTTSNIFVHDAVFSYGGRHTIDISVIPSLQFLSAMPIKSS